MDGVGNLILETEGRSEPGQLESNRTLELTILMPCLNEAETLATCIRKARGFLQTSGVAGEILVADNGSIDNSREIATAEGARVVLVKSRGYGATTLGGIAAALGRFVIMGDADDSYDFLNLMPFLAKLRSGADVVIGNRFRGGIAPGAMPFLHRYLGNPLLSFLGRLFFQIKIGDFHCGLRGFERERISALRLCSTGMEFASEMLVRAASSGYHIVEVPTALNKDGRSRPPHLRTWSDGWRHLRFLLMFSPRWLFLYPGVIFLVFGVIGTATLLPGMFYIGAIGIDIHTYVVGCMSILLGLQSISFAVVARRFGTAFGFMPASPHYGSLLEKITLEKVLAAAAVLLVLGLSGLLWCFLKWASIDFGPLQYASLIRILMLSLTAVAAAMQLSFTAFLAGITEIPARR
jgi:glycosyltransferase involved in cell wall biosynthesis